jgi:ABC-type branched-subunit amino acid transport system substrate-binding protein
VTANEIRIGFHTPNPGSTAAIYAALGIAVADPDGKAESLALVNYINAHGGIAGRRVVAVNYVDDGSGSWSADNEAACSAFTEDNHVFAAISIITTPESDVLASCLAQHQTAFVFNNRIVWDQRMFDSWAPYVYAPSYIEGDRWGSIIDQLVADNYFDPGSKLGLLWQETGSTKRTLDSVIKPRLSAHGIPVSAEFAYSPPDSEGGLSNVSAQIESAVLRFRASGVTHVVFVGTSGEGSLFFIPEAESQGYHPRYGFTSMEIPQIIAATVPKDQLHRAVGIGWVPTMDVDTAQDPNNNPAQALCLRIMQQAGVSIPGRWAQSQTVKLCDGVFFLQAALARAPTLTAAGLRQGVTALGSSYRSSFTFGTQFGTGRWDGVAALRPEAFDDSCGCWRYVARPTTLS